MGGAEAGATLLCRRLFVCCEVGVWCVVAEGGSMRKEGRVDVLLYSM